MSDDRLERYRRMRDFAATPEPGGSPVGEVPPAGRLRFVVQQHDATRLHWDLRLEHEGVLVSFALPRGLPWTPDENRMAVHTEDHPLEYIDFHGEIPKGEYGGGKMVIWDRGTYEVEKFEDSKVVVSLEGARVRGKYSLFATRGKDWMIHRMDPPQDSARRPIPTDLRPMRGVPGDLPDHAEGWAFEIRWRGLRVLASNDAGHVEITDGSGTQVSAAFPEVRRIGRALGAVECVLDGVLVAVDRSGQATGDGQVVHQRRAESSDSRIRRLSEDQPVAMMAVDLLWLEGHPTVDLPYDQRRQLLHELELSGPAWQAPSNHVGDGGPLLELARAQDLAGLVAKRRDSPYQPGEASDDWRLVT